MHFVHVFSWIWLIWKYTYVAQCQKKHLICFFVSQINQISLSLIYSLSCFLARVSLPPMSTPPCCYYNELQQRRKSSHCLSAQSPDRDYGSRYHSSSSLSKYRVSLGEKAPSTSNLLVPPHASNQRRHSIGERLAAVLHIGQSPEGKWKGHHKDSF